jgi:TrmH family RNA methyltransferase
MALKQISSADNPRFKSLARLLGSARQRKKTGLALLDGVHLVSAYADHAGVPESLAVSRSGLENPEIAGLLGRLSVEPVVLSDALFRQLSPVTTPTGIMATIRTPAVTAPAGDARACVLLEDIQDPGNLGSILRSAAAAGIADVYVSPGCADPWSPRVLRAGSGSHFSLRIREDADLAATAAGYAGRAIATVREGPISVFDADLTGNVALIFGNEGMGISAELRACAGVAVTIPMPGAAESLNVAAAAAVCLFERVRQLAAAHIPRDRPRRS